MALLCAERSDWGRRGASGVGAGCRVGRGGRADHAVRRLTWHLHLSDLAGHSVVGRGEPRIGWRSGGLRRAFRAVVDRLGLILGEALECVSGVRVGDGYSSTAGTSVFLRIRQRRAVGQGRRSGARARHPVRDET